MTPVTPAPRTAGRRSDLRQAMPARPWFEWTAVACGTALAAGVHVDAWAHGHVARTLETFFTPWHALLYASLAATTLFLVACAACTGAPPWEWPRALPAGYALPLAGCVTFGIGGVLDMAWHLAFGIERGFEALISPTHLILIVSGGLIVSGPLVAALLRRGRGIGWPAIASAMLTLTLLTFFGQFAHPYTSQWAAAHTPPGKPEQLEELGILGIILHTALLMAVVMLLLRRFDLPFGSLTFVMGVNAVFVTLIDEPDPVIVVGGLGGLAADLLRAALRPSPARLLQLRLFALLVPLVAYAIYFAGLICRRRLVAGQRVGGSPGGRGPDRLAREPGGRPTRGLGGGGPGRPAATRRRRLGLNDKFPCGALGGLNRIVPTRGPYEGEVS